MTKAIYPGTFDPITLGHLNIIERAAKLFDSVDVVVANNSSKDCLFSLDERVAFIDSLVAPIANVSVHSHSGFVVDYAKAVGAKILIRGLRNSIDFSYEFDLALINHNLCCEVETVFIPTDQRYLLIKSSAIKELAKYGGDVSSMVSENVQRALKEKFCKKNGK